MPTRLLIAAAALAALAGPAAAIEPGTYGCFTRGGTELEGRRFTIDGTGDYRSGGEVAGDVRVQGQRIYFRGGPLAGRQALALPEGRIRLSPKVFCHKVLEPAAPAPIPEPAAIPESSEPPAKLIKVAPGTADPRLIKAAP